MNMIDLTHTLSTSISVCPGHPKFEQQPILTLGKDASNVQSISLGSHTGTHIDAPFHFFAEGQSVDQLDLDMLVGQVVVIDVRGKKARESITWDNDLATYASHLKAGLILLFCTGWSRYWGQATYYDHPYLDVEAARKLVDMEIKVIGFDTLSPDEFPLHDDAPCFDVHTVILGAGGVIAENLNNLESLLNMDEDLMVSLLPLKLGGCDGSPVRATAWSVDSKCSLHFYLRVSASLTMQWISGHI
jgi:kynurenine formamidase